MEYKEQELRDELIKRLNGRNQFNNSMVQSKPLIGDERSANIARKIENAAIGLFGGTPSNETNDLSSKIALLNYRKDLNTNPLDDKLKQAQIDALESVNSQPVPTGFVKVGGKIVQDPTYKDPNKLTASQELAKDRATKEIYDTYEMNKARKGVLDKALQGSDTIPQGFFGLQRMKFAKSFPSSKGFLGITNDAIQNAQEMKMALTMGTLAETAYTKGAISDQEMALFKEASDNNDFNSPAIVPVLQKIRSFLDAQESGLYGAYQKNYGEDPRNWFNQENQNPVVNQSQEEDPIIRTGTDQATGKRVGQTKSGKTVFLT